MNFEQFVKKHKTQKKAADALGCSQGLISQRLKKGYRWTPNVVIDLEERSNGEISRYHQLPEVFGHPPDQPQQPLATN
jgi:DNA-binding transcriptional regulator YdaS (Cro superfamily)